MHNFDKKEELEGVGKWLNRLNTHKILWESGDKETKKHKTADIVNHSQKIAIELKREKGDSLDNKDRNLDTLSNRMEDYIKLSNRKFESYDLYKTILIVELKSNIESAKVAMSGIRQLHFSKDGNLVSHSIKNKKLYLESKNIGAIVLWPATGNHFSRACYFNNNFSDPNRKVTHHQVQEILDCTLEFFDLKNKI